METSYYNMEETLECSIVESPDNFNIIECTNEGIVVDIEAISINNDDNNEILIEDEDNQYYDMDTVKKVNLQTRLYRPPEEPKTNYTMNLNVPSPSSYNEYSQEEIVKSEDSSDSSRTTATSTPSGILNIDQMSGPNGTKPKKSRGGARRVAKVKELKDPLAQAIAKCRPYVEKRKQRVNLKDKDLQMEQKKKNALTNSERFRKRNKEHIQNLEDLCNDKTSEYSAIHKRCSDFTAMEHQLEINFRKNRTKAMNFVNELADYCHLNEDAGNRLDQHMQFSSYCTLEDMQIPFDMYGDATYTEDKEKKLENYNLTDAQRGNNDIAMEDKHDSESPSSSQADNNDEYSEIGSYPNESKKANKGLSKEDRRKDSNRRASAKCRNKEKNTIASLEAQIREKWSEIAEIKDLEVVLAQVYNGKLKKAQDCILPLCDWVHYLLGSLTQQIHVARRDQIVIDIEEIRQTYDVKPCTSTLI
ncbi:hypothetical protein WR25_10307 isoform C [Diploscapter pachys]|uniref:BZIP domain-containing protein n=1 Tax=Diploscapter pachys TaxID=2018661 RepID=A0A2A2KYA0_9BILA|nr:hypothetical protein WR25_10307 isoform A [Diploscapter pachys]PAV78976.1 hypothetical protein WR25_10307 isoform B [Diploscapter pachys]PAV78977.1 hypothetical protein WR25_10307 isoform C [Diploscapter pachys]